MKTIESLENDKPVKEGSEGLANNVAGLATILRPTTVMTGTRMSPWTVLRP